MGTCQSAWAFTCVLGLILRLDACEIGTLVIETSPSLPLRTYVAACWWRGEMLGLLSRRKTLTICLHSALTPLHFKHSSLCFPKPWPNSVPQWLWYRGPPCSCGFPWQLHALLCVQVSGHRMLLWVSFSVQVITMIIMLRKIATKDSWVPQSQGDWIINQI